VANPSHRKLPPSADFAATSHLSDPVGKVSDDDERLISAARECLDEAIRVSKPGYAFKDLGKVIEDVARKRGFTVNKTYGGHGINQLFHTRPNISHYEGNKCPGTMKAGMTFTIEPMICVGNQQEMHWPDNVSLAMQVAAASVSSLTFFTFAAQWTATTRDGKKSAQFEETMVVTETGVEILTAAPGWTLPPKAEDLP
jgi:methionyl aminopeptidase